MEQLTLRWHGHACFTLTCQDFTVVFDPYEDNYVPGFPPLHLSADLVLCSHQHNDHNAAGIVSLRTGHDNPFHITEIPTFHDPEGGQYHSSVGSGEAPGGPLWRPWLSPDAAPAC